MAQGQDAAPNTATNQPGPIPYERFYEVNERMKAAEQNAARWQKAQEQFGDLSQVDPTVYRTAMGLVNQLRTSPVEAVTALINELSANDQYRPQLASQAARLLNGLRVKQPAEDPEPQPDLMAENGSPVYSATQQRSWLEWNQRKMQANFEQKLADATAPLRDMQREREIAKVQQHAESVASQMYERAKTWHGFKENEAKIREAFAANPGWQLQDAYLHVLHTDILPKLPAQAQAKVVADLQQKAAAQTINPSGASAPAAPDFKGDFAKALAFYAKQGR